jgi:hypothetical protein
LGVANYGMRDDYNDVFGYDPVTTRRYGELTSYLAGFDPDQVYFPQAPAVMEPDVEASRRLHRLQLKVRTATPVPWSYRHTQQPLNALPFLQMLRCRLVMLATDQGILPAAGVIDPLPHLLMVHDWKIIPVRDARLTELTGLKFDPHEQVILEREPRVDGEPLGQAQGSALGQAPGAADPALHADEPPVLLHSSTDWLEIEVNTSGGILVVTDGYASGWHVEPIGAAPQATYEVLPANQLLRAIPLKAGHHHFILEYVPPGYRAGKIVTGVALIACAVAMGFLWFHRSRKLLPLAASQTKTPPICEVASGNRSCP